MSFTAQYFGHCSGCGEPIWPGSLIDGESGDYAHAECSAEPKSAEVCTDCFLEKPCPCEDYQ